MVRPFRSIALPALFILLPYTTTTTAYQTGVENGPNVLDECVACPYLYTNFYKCQQIAQPARAGDEVRSCVCVPFPDADNWRSDHGSWYTYIDACRGCLPFTGSDDFLGNLGRMMNALLGECRGGGNITSDGAVLCASNNKYENCMALRDSSEGETWVSFRALEYPDGKYDSNRTQLLNLAAVKPNLTTTTSTSTVDSATTTPATATGLEDTAASTTTAPATGTGTQGPSAATDPQSASTTANPSFAARLSQGSQAGYVVGMLIVAGIVGGLV